MTETGGEVCPGSEELMGAVLSGDATPEERAALGRHLMSCATCARAMQGLGGFRGRLLEAYGKVEDERIVPLRPARTWRRVAAWTALPLAASLLVAVLIGRGGPSPELISSTDVASIAPDSIAGIEIAAVSETAPAAQESETGEALPPSREELLAAWEELEEESLSAQDEYLGSWENNEENEPTAGTTGQSA